MSSPCRYPSTLTLTHIHTHLTIWHFTHARLVSVSFSRGRSSPKAGERNEINDDQYQAVDTFGSIHSWLNSGRFLPWWQDDVSELNQLIIDFRWIGSDWIVVSFSSVYGFFHISSSVASKNKLDCYTTFYGQWINETRESRWMCLRKKKKIRSPISKASPFADPTLLWLVS